MKKPSPRVIYIGCAALATCALITIPVIISAIPSASTDPPAVTTDTPAVTTEADTEAESMRAHYDGLVAELQDTILNLKEEDYATRLEYETKIAQLEAELELLKEATEVTTPPAETEESTSDTVTEPAPAATFYYRIEHGQATIYDYEGSERRIAVPATVDGYPVTRIDDNTFRDSNMVSVVIPESVTDIGWFAFSGCTSLVSVTLPSTLSFIGYGAFEGCPDLIIFCPEDSYAADYALSFGIQNRYT